MPETLEAPVPAAVATPPVTAPAPAVAPTPAVETPAAPTDSILGGAKAPDSKTETVKTDLKTESVAPEKYTDFKLPEGMQIDKGMLEKAVPLFKELNLSQEAAQKLVSFQAESEKAAITARLADFDNQIKGWRAETLKALGPSPEKEIGFAGKALDAFGSPELRQLLTQTGFGENVLLTKMLVAVGKAMSEAKSVEGVRTAPMDPFTQTKLDMFPSMKEQILAGNGHK